MLQQSISPKAHKSPYPSSKQLGRCGWSIMSSVFSRSVIKLSRLNWMPWMLLDAVKTQNLDQIMFYNWTTTHRTLLSLAKISFLAFGGRADSRYLNGEIFSREVCFAKMSWYVKVIAEESKLISIPLLSSTDWRTSRISVCSRSVIHSNAFICVPWHSLIALPNVQSMTKIREIAALFNWARAWVFG